MNVSIKFATGLILAATALVASGSAALAGEGGAAGSVSIKFAGTSTAPAGGGPAVPDVSRLSTSVAVGKGYAGAVARTVGDNTNTSAFGSAGAFALSDANSAAPGFTSTTEGNDPGLLDLTQANSLSGSGATTLAPTTGITLAD